MKRLAVVLGLVVLLSLAFVGQAMAAPTVTVSGKYQAFGPISSAGVELGFPINDHFSFIVQGGPTLPAYAGGVMAGLRYYMTPIGLRPFATIYGGCAVTPFVFPFGAGTVGLEYLSENGFRVAGEIGAVIFPGGWMECTYGVAVGYAF